MPFTKLRYHIITRTKSSRRIITPSVELILYARMKEVASACDGCMFALGGVEDHVHWVAAVPPVMPLSTFIGRVKSQSSSTVREHPDGDPSFQWAIGYSAFTADPARLGSLLRYVHNQKHHHSTDDLRPGWEPDPRR